MHDVGRWMWFVLATCVASVVVTACDEFACGYGGAGCSDPIVAGFCETTLVVGQEYRAVFGFQSDTGVSEAKVTKVVSDAENILQAGATPGSPDVPYASGPTGPFDLNNGPGDGGMSLRAVAPGKANVTISLEGWEKSQTMTFEIVDEANAPEGFIPVTASERFAQCIERTSIVK